MRGSKYRILCCINPNNRGYSSIKKTTQLQILDAGKNQYDLYIVWQTRGQKVGQYRQRNRSMYCNNKQAFYQCFFINCDAVTKTCCQKRSPPVKMLCNTQFCPSTSVNFSLNVYEGIQRKRYLASLKRLMIHRRCAKRIQTLYTLLFQYFSCM